MCLEEYKSSFLAGFFCSMWELINLWSLNTVLILFKEYTQLRIELSHIKTGLRLFQFLTIDFLLIVTKLVVLVE